jgi:hypothetical protein
MPYKRPNQGSKKFLPAYDSKKTGSKNIFGSDYGGDFISIPMPNEREVFKYPWGKGKGLPGLHGILNFVREHIRLEEIILIGLIILLLDESIEDDFLLIILIYILLF